MSKKDYVLIAKLLSKHLASTDYSEEAQDLVVDFARALHEDNERFDMTKFMDAVYSKTPWSWEEFRLEEPRPNAIDKEYQAELEFQKKFLKGMK